MQVKIDKGMVDIEDKDYAISFLVRDPFTLIYWHWINCEGEPNCDSGFFALPGRYSYDINIIEVEMIK